MEKIKLLAYKSLSEKWYPESLKLVSSFCPFCKEVLERNSEDELDSDICSTCLCPNEICSGCGLTGIVGECCDYFDITPLGTIGGLETVHNLPDLLLRKIMIALRDVIIRDVIIDD